MKGLNEDIFLKDAASTGCLEKLQLVQLSCATYNFYKLLTCLTYIYIQAIIAAALCNLGDFFLCVMGVLTKLLHRIICCKSA